MNNNQYRLLDDICNEDWNCLMQEIETDENIDYRRGFKAGALFSSLRLRNVIRSMENAHEHE